MKSGGSATIYGILYQILSCLDWAANIVLKDTELTKDDISTTCLIIEPSGGGGDIRIHTGTKRIVEQWKAKSNYGSWSLNDVIEKVIPDLYLAVDADHLDDNCEYNFVTEGRIGTWEKALDFFITLSKDEIPEDPIAALRDNEKIKFSSVDEYTPRQLFQLIATEVRKRKNVSAEPEKLTYKKLWYLLPRFYIKENIRKDELQRRIDSFLMGIVDYHEDVEAKRNELSGVIMDLASIGEARITPQALFEKTGMTIDSFRNWYKFKKTLFRDLNDKLQRKNYLSENDVRKSPSWPTNYPVLVFAAESGYGKTWQLARLANEAFTRTDGVAVFISSIGNAEKDLSKAADIVWKKGLNKDRELSMDRISERKRKVVPEVPSPWLTICIDDVTTMRLAKDIINSDLPNPDIRLAFATTSSIGKALKKEFPEIVNLIELGDFTLDELMRYLSLYKREWGTIPPDVRKLLHNPLLSSLYVNTAADAHWTPSNEYELFRKYWLRIRDDKDQIDHPDDILYIRRLVETILDQGTKYSWTPEIVKSAGVTEEVHKRLESLGWLRRLENGDSEIWHDRLLNWAVAEVLVENRRANRITTEELGAHLTKFYGAKHLDRSLGYVPMDVMWLASDSSCVFREDVSKLIAALGKPEHLSIYEELLPTLGERIVPSLIKRLKDSITDEDNPYSITRSLLKIAERYPDNVSHAAIELISEPIPVLREAALKILAKHPGIEVMERIWEIHKENSQALYDKKRPYRHLSYEKSFEALNSCVKKNPEWLLRKFNEINPQNEPVWELAYLLANLDEQVGRVIYEGIKSRLFSVIPSCKLRGVIRCISHYRDVGEISRLEQWLQIEEDLAGPTAFSVLTEMAPESAINQLPNLSPSNLSSFRNWWLPNLLLRKPMETRNIILRKMKEDKDKLWITASIYQGHENQMDSATLDLLLDTLDQELRDHFDQLISEEPPWLHLRLLLLAAIHKSELLKTFEKKAGSELEERLVRIACSWTGRSTLSFNSSLRYGRLILLKIGGTGLTTLINHELAQQNEYDQREGIRWALVKPNDATEQLLKDIINSANLSIKPELSHVQFMAIRVLAMLDDKNSVIESVLRWGGNVPPDLWEYLEDKPSIRDELLKDVILILEDIANPAIVNAVIAIALSGRIDFMPRIQQIFKDATVGSELARVALIALRNLGCKNDDIVNRTDRELSGPNSYYAMDLLLKIGTKPALAKLKEDFLKSNSFSSMDFRLAYSLWKLTKDKEIASLVWRNINIWQHISTKSLSVIANMDDPMVLAFLWDKAFPSESSGEIPGLSVSAIKAIYESNPASAYNGALLMLAQAKRDREMLPDALIKMDAERSIPRLCEQMTIETSTLTRWAIDRALRGQKQLYSELIVEQIGKMLKDTDVMARAAGAELAGWLQQNHFRDDLYELALNDISDKVRRTAINAITRKQSESEVIQLMDEFKIAEKGREWAILEAILNLGDPLLLQTQNDPIWLGKILSDRPAYLADYAMDVLKKKEEELKKRAEEVDKSKS